MGRLGKTQNPRRPESTGVLWIRSEDQTKALMSSGMPGPNVVDTAPFWM